MSACLRWTLLLLLLAYLGDQTKAVKLRGFRDVSPHRQLGSTTKRRDTHDTSTNLASNDGNGGDNSVDSTTPEQVHIALASAKPRETYAVSVSWVTWGDAKSQVFWGREADALTEVVAGNSSSELTPYKYYVDNGRL